MSRYTFNPKLDPNRDRNRRVLIGAIAFGAVIVLGADLLSRAVAFPVETPAGVVTALIGAPFFLFLARRAL